ncbi:MAG: VOC family protein [Deltaproteobacteria bacterium]
MMQEKLKGWLQEYRLMIFLVSIMLGVTAFAGCSSSDNTVPPPVLTGTFVDGPVAGLGYTTPSLDGVTDATGAFRYRPGETVTFSAGEIVLGSAKGKAVMTPVDLVSGVASSANMTAVNISRFLQLVDVDGDHINGIEITPGIRDLLTWNAADGTNDGSIFEDENSIFRITGTFSVFMNQILTTLNAGAVFTALVPRTLLSRSATGARRNLNTTLTALTPHPFAPLIKEVGIGVTDLNVSMPFYENIMGLKFVDYQGRADRVEVLLEDNRASNTNKVALMQFNDPAVNCTNRPVKLVFAVPNVDALYAAITAPGAGGTGFAPPADQPGLGRIAMALDPDGYLLELIQVATLAAPYLSGVGIGVGSIQPIDDFYTRVLGMRFNYYLYVAGFMNEMIMQSPLSPSTTLSYGMDVVLMNYFTPRVYVDVPAKITFTVADPGAVMQAIAREGLTIIQQPAAGVRGIAKDANGYEVEIAQAPAP